MKQVFKPGGSLAQHLGDGYKFRQGQLEMAQAVESAIQHKHHLFVEAGTGTGKSLAYLVPLLLSGKRAYIVTASKKLQDQLLNKDIPLLQNLHPMQASVLKGRSNYVCLLKLHAYKRERGNVPDETLRKLDKELTFTPTGDLDHISLKLDERSKFATGFGECPGKKCKHFEECYYEVAKRKADQCQIVILNHSIFAYALRIESLLPRREVIVLDEAHEFEDQVSNALKDSVYTGNAYALSRSSVVNQVVPEKLVSDISVTTTRLFKYIEAQFKNNEDRQSRRLDATNKIGPELQDALQLATIIGDLAKRLNDFVLDQGRREPEHAALADQLAQEATNLSQAFRAIGSAPPEDSVRYAEIQANSKSKTVGIHLQKADVSAFLSETLFERHDTVIATSATLQINRSFHFIRNRLGAPQDKTQELHVLSPFDYAKQGLLYIAPNLDPPQTSKDRAVNERAKDEYRKKVKRVIERLIALSQGRAFVLCTSSESMRWYHAAFQSVPGITPLLQGDKPQNELLDLMRSTTDAAGNPANYVLFATRGFWTGIDIQGDALSLVILDRLPFGVPSDPLFSRRSEIIEGEGGRGFNDLSLPTATFALLQGVGRLIRSERDRGVVVILDSRLKHMRYGPTIVNDLPPLRQVESIDEIEAFFNQLRAETKKEENVSIATHPVFKQVDLLDFQLVRKIGEGGFGEVFEGLDKRNGQKVAVKSLLDKHLGQEDTLQRFVNEVKGLARFNHPHLVRFIDARRHQGVLYLIMEYVVGGSLHNRLQQTEQLPETEVRRYLTQIAMALDVIHRENVVHRDLKPANILLTEDGTVKVADFGISHIPQAIAGMAYPLTQTGQQLGTPMYMSPEQLEGHAVDPRSDLYALGVMTYQMLSGQFYFEWQKCDNIWQMRRLIVEGEPTPLTQLVPGLSPAIVHIVNRLMEKTPDARFQSTDALLKALMATNINQPEITQRIDRIPQGPPKSISASTYKPAAQIDSDPAPSSGFLSRIWRSIVGGRK